MATIVLIDDSKLTHELAQAVLTPLGHRVAGLPDTGGLLEHLNHWQPQLIILDYFLPATTGREIYKWIRAQPQGRTAPILFLTGKPIAEVKILINDDPRVSFLQKPFTPHLLAQAVTQALGG